MDQSMWVCAVHIHVATYIVDLTLYFLPSLQAQLPWQDEYFDFAIFHVFSHFNHPCHSKVDGIYILVSVSRLHLLKTPAWKFQYVGKS